MNTDLRQLGQSLVGKTIAEKYLLTRLIGIGGMGSVYEGLHALTLRRVAVKMIHAWALESAAAAKRFIREAQAAAQIEHPAVVDVLDAGTLADGSSYLVFELLEGEDLETGLTRGDMTLRELLDVVIVVLDGLDAAHARGFVHRDIKPANIFIGARGGKREIKLLDFGIAKRLESTLQSAVTAQGMIVGTLDYMSPEQALGGSVDARADLWGCGVLLYRALTGHTPFDGATPVAVIEQIIKMPIPPLDTRLPPQLVAIVNRCLERDRFVRYQSAAQLRDALLACELGNAAQQKLSSGGTREAVTPRSGDFDHGDETEIEGVPLIRSKDSDDSWVQEPERSFSSERTAVAGPPANVPSSEAETTDVSEDTDAPLSDTIPPSRAGTPTLPSGVLPRIARGVSRLPSRLDMQPIERTSSRSDTSDSELAPLVPGPATPTPMPSPKRGIRFLLLALVLALAFAAYLYGALALRH